MKRTLIYFVYHPKGRIDLYIPHMLTALRSRFDHIHVVFNGRLEEGAAAQLHMADTIQERPNIEFDVGAYRAAIKALPGKGLADIDELTLANFTFFGPLNNMQNIWDWAAATDADFWGLSAHGALDHNPFGEGEMPYHINSHWITIRAPMLHSEHFSNWWRDMPKIESYADSVLHHESKFTEHFGKLGFRHAAFLDPAQGGAAYPAFDEAHAHIPQGFPILKRRLFYHTPVAYSDWHGANPRQALVEISERCGYDTNLIWQSLAGEVDPWVLHQNADLLFVVDSTAQALDTFDAPIFLLHIHERTQPKEFHLFGQALNIPIQLHLIGEPRDAITQMMHDHPLVRSVVWNDAGSALSACAPEAVVLLGHLAPDQGNVVASGLDQLAYNPAVACNAMTKLSQTKAFGLAFPPVQTHGQDAQANAPLQLNDHPVLGQGAKVAWVRAQLAQRITATWPAPENWAKIAADSGSITIAISNSEVFPRSFVKLEARYRALASQLDARNPLEAPAQLAHHIAYPTNPETKQAWETAAEIAHDAGHTSGFHAGYSEGYAAAHTPAFEDGYQRGVDAIRAQKRSRFSRIGRASNSRWRLLRWRT